MRLCVEKPPEPTEPSTSRIVKISREGLGILRVSTYTQGQLPLHKLSISKRGVIKRIRHGWGFLSLGSIFLEAIQGIPYYGFSILERTSIRSIRSTPHQEVAV